MDHVLVMSIKPEYAQAIYSGVKIFEFRKKAPTNMDAIYLVYESAPVSKITGSVIFSLSFTARAGDMVKLIMRVMKVRKYVAVKMMGISEKELIAYAGGKYSYITALMISSPFRSSYYEAYKIRPPQNWGRIVIV